MAEKETVMRPASDTDKPEPRKKRAARRNYADELRDLESRRDMAVRLLRKTALATTGPTAEQDNVLIETAIETLEGN